MPVLGAALGVLPLGLLLCLWGSTFSHSNYKRSPSSILISRCRAAHTGIYGFCGLSWRCLG